METIPFSHFDSRISDVCATGLPQQPHVAAYLASRLRELGGSVLVARLFVEALASIPHTRMATQADVDRLAVDHDQTLLRAVDQASASAHKRDAICGLVAAFHEDSEPFATQDGTRQWREPMAIRHSGGLLAVFNCAYAMVSGVTIDPRVVAKRFAPDRPAAG